jgi:hypothetical protein
LRSSFRHYIGLPDDMFPDAWSVKNSSPWFSYQQGLWVSFFIGLASFSCTRTLACRFDPMSCSDESIKKDMMKWTSINLKYTTNWCSSVPPTRKLDGLQNFRLCIRVLPYVVWVQHILYAREWILT